MNRDGQKNDTQVTQEAATEQKDKHKKEVIPGPSVDTATAQEKRVLQNSIPLPAFT